MDVRPGHSFSSIDFSHNASTPVHKDAHNHHRVQTATFPVSEFCEWGLWIEELGGSVLSDDIAGVIKPVTWPYLTFDWGLPMPLNDGGPTELFY